MANLLLSSLLFSCPKLVSLAPSITDTLYYLKAQDCLIGNTIYYKDNKEKVGGIINPDLEKIVKLRPDYVLATPLTPRRVILALKRLGFKVIVLKYQSLEDVKRSVKLLAKLTSHPYKDFKIDFKNLGKGRKALIMVDCENLIVAGKNTYLSEFFEKFGFKNLSEREGYYRIDLEFLYKNKDALLIEVCPNKRDFKDFKELFLKEEYFLIPSPQKLIKGAKYLKATYF